MSIFASTKLVMKLVVWVPFALDVMPFSRYGASSASVAS
uniref:Unannotated protein n=1 Tax=freshwater metagenome TaxID=449393 RepID=A0A6J5Z664_9ZZZZ